MNDLIASHGTLIAEGFLGTLRVVAIGFVTGAMAGAALGAIACGPAGWARMLVRCYVELIRNTPFLVQASLLFALFGVAGVRVSTMALGIAAVALYTAAYMAEIVRGGLQAIPKGQLEAADTLGLSYWQTQRKIVLPQALAMVVPSMMNNFISIFKDTSLVTIVSLYELTGALSLALNSDVEWRPFKIEAYFFITLVYFLFCFAMSRYSLWVEKQLSASKAR